MFLSSCCWCRSSTALQTVQVPIPALPPLSLAAQPLLDGDGGGWVG